MIRMDTVGIGLVETLPTSVLGPKTLSTEGAYTYRLFDARSSTDMVRLRALVGRAWSRDYDDRSVIQFDTNYLLWLLGGRRWFGIDLRRRIGSPGGLRGRSGAEYHLGSENPARLLRDVADG